MTLRDEWASKRAVKQAQVDDWPTWAKLLVAFVFYGLLFAGIVFAFLVFTDDAAAFHGSIPVQSGCSELHVDSAITTGTRGFAVATNDANIFYSGADALNCAAAGASDRDYEPGQRIVLTYRTATTGLAPPAQTDTMVIGVRFDHQAGVTIRTLSTGAPPTNGTTYDFWATHDGTSLGTPAAGTLRPYIRVNHDEVVNANDYDCNTDDEEVSVGANVECRSMIGFFRSGINATSITAPAPPAGAFYAFGTSSDETVTVTATRTRAFRLETANDLRITAINQVPATVEQGPRQDHTTAATTVQSFTIDQTFASGTATYGARFRVSGNSGLSTIPHTFFNQAGVGGGVVWVNNTRVRDLNVFDANPDVNFDRDGTGPADQLVTTNHDSYNRGESVSWSAYMLNARDEKLTRSMTVQVRDIDTSTLVDSHVGTGPFYTDTFVLASTDPAENETEIGLGEAYRFRLSATDMAAFSLESFQVHSRYLADCHTQATTSLMKDPIENKNAAETTLFTIAVNVMSVWTNVSTIRGDGAIDTNGNVLHMRVKQPDGTVEDSLTTDTGTDGWSTGKIDQPVIPPAGTWINVCMIRDSSPFNGNTAYDVQPVNFGSPVTENLITEFYYVQEPGLDHVFTFYLRHREAFTSTEYDLAVPTMQPRILLTRVDEDDLDAVPPEPSFFDLELADPMLNAANHTATINGSVYYYRATLEELGAYHVTVYTQMGGSDLYRPAQFSIQSHEGFGVGGLSNGATLETAFYFGVLVAGLLAGWPFVAFAGLAALPRHLYGAENWPLDFNFNMLLIALAFVGQMVAQNKLGVDKRRR